MREARKAMEKSQPDLVRAVKSATLVLADGKWYPIDRVRRIASAYDIPFDTLSDELQLAISESEKWVCLPKDTTPQQAPDE